LVLCFACFASIYFITVIIYIFTHGYGIMKIAISAQMCFRSDVSQCIQSFHLEFEFDLAGVQTWYMHACLRRSAQAPSRASRATMSSQSLPRFIGPTLRGRTEFHIRCLSVLYSSREDAEWWILTNEFSHNLEHPVWCGKSFAGQPITRPRTWRP
jgi:hypothetical protein